MSADSGTESAKGELEEEVWGCRPSPPALAGRTSLPGRRNFHALFYCKH